MAESVRAGLLGGLLGSPVATTSLSASSVPEERKGKRLVLLTERKNPERQELLERARTEGVSEVHVPKHLIATDAIPLLGVGKTHYAAARTLVEKEFGDEAKTPSR